MSFVVWQRQLWVPGFLYSSVGRFPLCSSPFPPLETRLLLAEDREAQGRAGLWSLVSSVTLNLLLFCPWMFSLHFLLTLVAVVWEVCFQYIIK